MKNLIIILSLLSFNLAFSQDLEDRDDSFILENNKNLLKIDIKEPFMQVKAKCTDFKEASFDSGIASYKEYLKNGMYKYLNSEFYTLNGEFVFTLSIDKNGKVVDLEGTPKVENSKVFFDDMQYIVRRIKTNWKPATCAGDAVDSKMKIRINFNSLSADM